MSVSSRDSTPSRDAQEVQDLSQKIIQLQGHKEKKYVYVKSNRDESGVVNVYSTNSWWKSLGYDIAFGFQEFASQFANVQEHHFRKDAHGKTIIGKDISQKEKALISRANAIAPHRHDRGTLKKCSDALTSVFPSLKATRPVASEGKEEAALMKEMDSKGAEGAYRRLEVLNKLAPDLQTTLYNTGDKSRPLIDRLNDFWRVTDDVSRSSIYEDSEDRNVITTELKNIAKELSQEIDFSVTPFPRREIEILELALIKIKSNLAFVAENIVDKNRSIMKAKIDESLAQYEHLQGGLKALHAQIARARSILPSETTSYAEDLRSLDDAMRGQPKRGVEGRDAHRAEDRLHRERLEASRSITTAESQIRGINNELRRLDSSHLNRLKSNLSTYAYVKPVTQLTDYLEWVESQPESLASSRQEVAASPREPLRREGDSKALRDVPSGFKKAMRTMGDKTINLEERLSSLELATRRLGGGQESYDVTESGRERIQKEWGVTEEQRKMLREELLKTAQELSQDIDFSSPQFPYREITHLRNALNNLDSNLDIVADKIVEKNSETIRATIEEPDQRSIHSTNSELLEDYLRRFEINYKE